MNPVHSNGTGQPDNSPETIRERLECLADLNWAMDDPEVQEKYWDEFVAVYQKEVVAHGSDMVQLLDEAERVTGIPRHRIMVAKIGWY